MLPTGMQPNDDSYPTRASLLERLKDTGDQRSWEEFHNVYGRLIRGFALKAGLTETEADEVVQETMAGAAQHLPAFRYDPQRCAFKTWLMNLARWRVIDQFRKRLPTASPAGPATDETRTATIERVPDPAGSDWEQLWDGEWRTTPLQKALERVKQKVDPRQWQIFDLYTLKQWTPREIAHTLGINVGRVYLTKHRLGMRLQNELKRIEELET